MSGEQDNKEHAEWTAKMLRIALTNLITKEATPPAPVAIGEDEAVEIMATAIQETLAHDGCSYEAAKEASGIAYAALLPHLKANVAPQGGEVGGVREAFANAEAPNRFRGCNDFYWFNAGAEWHANLPTEAAKDVRIAELEEELKVYKHIETLMETRRPLTIAQIQQLRERAQMAAEVTFQAKDMLDLLDAAENGLRPVGLSHFDAKSEAEGEGREDGGLDIKHSAFVISRCARAYSLLWRYMGTDKNIHDARKMLKDCLTDEDRKAALRSLTPTKLSETTEAGDGK